MAIGPHNSIVGRSVLEDGRVLVGYRKAVILRCSGVLTGYRKAVILRCSGLSEGRREGSEITLFPQWTYLRHLQENGSFCLE